MLMHKFQLYIKKKSVPNAESSRSVRGLTKSISYPHLCNAKRPLFEPGTFWSQTVRLYRLHQAHPFDKFQLYIDTVKYTAQSRKGAAWPRLVFLV